MEISKVEKSWNYKFLVLEALGIIFVVFGHNQPINAFFNNIFLFYSFHMALFAFISGYFFRDDKIKNFLKRKTYKLIIIYLIWNFIYGVVVNILSKLNLINYGSELSLYNLFLAPFIGNSNQFGFNTPAWFMISLFFVSIIYFFVNKLLNKLKIKDRIFLTIIFIIIACIVLNLFQNGNLNDDYWKLVIRVSFLFPFYCIGILYKNVEKYDKLNNYAYFFIIIIIQAFMLQKFNRIDYNLNTFYFNHNYFVYLIVSLNGIMFWLRVSDIISRHFKDNKIIELIGKNTLTIMLHHLFCTFMLNLLIYALNMNFHILNKFDPNSFKNDIWYKYSNGANGAINLIYAILGISIPLILKYKVLHKIKCKIKNIRGEQNEEVTNKKLFI